MAGLRQSFQVQYIAFHRLTLEPSAREMFCAHPVSHVHHGTMLHFAIDKKLRGSDGVNLRICIERSHKKAKRPLDFVHLAFVAGWNMNRLFLQLLH